MLSLSEGIELQALTADEIEENLDELHPLYMKVYGRAAFRLGCLQAEDLVLLKRDMGEDFQVWSSRWEGRLIGFHCGMCNGEEVEVASEVSPPKSSRLSEQAKEPLKSQSS